MSSLRITGGTIYDPANGIDGDVGGTGLRCPAAFEVGDVAE